MPFRGGGVHPIELGRRTKPGHTPQVAVCLGCTVTGRLGEWWGTPSILSKRQLQVRVFPYFAGYSVAELTQVNYSRPDNH